MLIRYAVLISLGVFFFTGCVTQSVQATKEELQKLDDGRGILLVTYARSSPKERFSKESVYFRQTGDRKIREIGVTTLPLVPLKFDFEEENSYGKIYVIALPAGDYEIYDFAVIQDILGGSITHSPEQRFFIPFKVLAGKVSYLGELRIERLHAAKVLGLPGTDGVRFELSDQSQRDVALLRTKYPEIQLPVEIVKPAAGYSTPFIRIE